ncbi:MAG: hypothetical protein EA426_19255 [Spirochaetaceae bacterium]|nr:MAG: hypothetical protein EA426_19255 [Spirochaetaceae bacterium]
MVFLLASAAVAFGQADDSVTFSVSGAEGATVIEGRLTDGYLGEFDFSGSPDAQYLQSRDSTFDPVLQFERSQPVAAIEEGYGTVFFFASSDPIESADLQAVPAAGVTMLTIMVGGPQDGVRNHAFVMLLHNDGERVYFSSVHDQDLTIDDITVDEQAGRVDGRVSGTFELVGVILTADGTPDFENSDPEIVVASFESSFSSALTDQDVTMLARQFQ